MYPDGASLAAAYESELRRREDVPRGKGTCNAFSWGGERPWLHGPDKPGGRVFCYFDGNDAVIVWTHERLGQPTHRDILVTAREGGSDHAGLTRWWRPRTTRSARRPRRAAAPARCSRAASRQAHASFTHTCLIRVYSSIEYIDMSLP